VKEGFDILLADGQDHLKGKVFRIGNLGFVCDRDVLTAVAAVKATLQTLGLAKTAVEGRRCCRCAKEWQIWPGSLLFRVNIGRPPCVRPSSSRAGFSPWPSAAASRATLPSGS
jgi:hypothetical protein